MPTVSPDMVDTVQGFDIEDLLDTSSGGAGGNNTVRINGTSEIVSRRELVHVDMADTYEIPVTDGYIRYGHYEGTGPAYTTQEIQRVVQDPIDSNTSIIKRSTIKQPYNTSVDPTTGKMTVSGQPKSGMLSANAAYFINAVNAAQFCTSVGVALGKGFDSVLYNANPDYWDSVGMSSLNPETWASITAGETGLGAALFNTIFGIDPNTGKAQMYVDSTAFAYMAQYLYEKGAFNSGTVEYTPATFPTTGNIHVDTLVNPASIFTALLDKWVTYANMLDCTVIYPEPSQSRQISIDVLMSELAGYVNNVLVFNGQIPNAGTPPYMSTVAMFIYTSNATAGYDIPYNTSTSSYSPNHTYQVTITWDYANRSLKVVIHKDLNIRTERIRNVAYDYQSLSDSYTYLNNINGTYVEHPATEGITTQDNAQLPTGMENWTSPDATDASLRQQYPDLYANAIKYDVPDAQGNLIEKTYVPVAWPTTTANPWTDVQPTTDTAVQTQTQTMVDLLEAIQAQTGTLTKTLADTLTKTITQPVNTTPTGTVPPSENPTNTGSGTSPVPVTPTGNASALWSVYHPTQAQINAFGAWLWGSVFTTDIRKLFEDPIQSVISLHKIFASPVDSGTGTIVAGTLDSGVSSATVSQQYVTVSCGSVSIQEDFGNVFDYQPHTSVSLYLPFIGIVPLDVNDVMRSTITVTYGVDVFTGACLAMVDVSRDGGTVNMYQYAGVCSVQYPLSNVQQSQMVTGLLSIAAGIGAAVATGGVSIPASVGIAGGAAAAAKTSVGRSGGFSGNAGAMGIKKPYVIITRPQTKVAGYFPTLDGYPTNISGMLSEFSGQVVVSSVHVEGIDATDTELAMIENALHSGVLI